METTRTLAVIVTYQPTAHHLQLLAECLSKQVEHIIIIDNCSNNLAFDALKINANIALQLNNENIGLAAAYNQGIRLAKEQGFTHLILFDQDSMPGHDMLEQLHQALAKKNCTTLQAAAAGPKYIDIKGLSISPFVKIDGFRLNRIACAKNEIVEVDHLISSGCLIDMQALAKIGGFTDDLFIDYVDTEWCLRARYLGLLLLGVGSANMLHSIGEKHYKLLGKTIPIDMPVRLYYKFRNQVWLFKQPWVSWRWRLIDGVRIIQLLIAFVFFVPGKRTNLFFIIKGIKDGVFSRMGKIKD